MQGAELRRALVAAVAPGLSGRMAGVGSALSGALVAAVVSPLSGGMAGVGPVPD